MEVNPTVVSVTVVDADGAEFVTELAPATVNEFRMAVPETFSLNVNTMVLSAVLSAVNVGGVVSIVTVTDCAVKSAKLFGDVAVSVGLVPELVNATVGVSDSSKLPLNVNCKSLPDTVIEVTVSGPFRTVPAITKSPGVAPGSAIASLNVTSILLMTVAAALANVGAMLSAAFADSPFATSFAAASTRSPVPET